MVSPFSLTSAVVVYNLALVLIYLLRRKSNFLMRYGVGTVLFISLLAVVRLLLPVDLPQQVYIIHSGKIIPAVNSALDFELFPDLTVGIIAAWVWLAGTCCFAGKYVLEIYRAMRLRKFYVPARNEVVEQAALRLGIKYPVVISKQVSTPHTGGFFHPVIYLPDIEFAPEAWEYILRHEAQHIKSLDVWIKLFYAALEAVMWWNPVSHLFMRELDAVLELRCDGALAARMSEGERVEYLETVLAVLDRAVAESPEPVGACFARRGEYLRERFELVLSMGSREGRKTKYAVCAAAIAVFFFSFFVLVQPKYRVPAEEGTITVEKSEDEDQFILYDGEKYYFCSYGRVLSNLNEADIMKEPYNMLPVYGGIR